MPARLLILVVCAVVLDAADDRPRVVFLGDSLTAGYGVAASEAYPARIQERLDDEGLEWRVINAGKSGDTTKGALARLDWILRSDPEVVVVALGANDGLRGLAVDQLEANLRAIVARIREHGARVLFSGMTLPRNFGGEYIQRFDAVFPRVAADLDLAYDPFLLAGVAANPDLNLADGIHPNPEGHAAIAERLYPAVKAVLVAGSAPAATATVGEGEE